MYTYMSPGDAWNAKRKLIGKPMAYAHWARWDDSRMRDASMYSYRFRTLKRMLIGPHAYTLVFDDGRREELISYDIVCVYTVSLEKKS